MNNDIIKIENISKVFKTSEREIVALKNINLNIKKGGIYGIIGLSGAGKSTLVRLMNLLETPTDGHVYFEDKDLTNLSKKELLKVRKDIGMIFQSFNLLEQRNVLKNVLFPLEISNVARDKAIERAKELIKLVDLEDREKSFPSMLSGGQKQRVAIARALATNPKVLLCDEATSALDPKTTNQILNLLKKINKELGVTIVIITHQMSVIESICDEVAIIDKSEIVEKGLVSEIFKSPKSEIGKRLIFGENDTSEAYNIPMNSKNNYLRLVFDGTSTNEPILSTIILEHKLNLNILFANTKNIEDKTYGQMIVGIDKNFTELEEVKKYIKSHNIEVEEVK